MLNLSTEVGKYTAEEWKEYSSAGFSLPQGKYPDKPWYQKSV